MGRVLKACLDRLVAFALLVALAPLLLLVAVLVRLAMGAPVLFRQQRPGFRGRPFNLLKFRTMSNTAGPEGNLLPDEQRISRLGAVLRKTSIDELPQLINVLKGELSFVGPRPLLMEYLPLYSAEQARRHDAKPGITGWAQVNGRNSIGWEEKFRLDVWYVDHQSFGLDLKILWLTLVHVFHGRGVNADGHATMPKFEGSEKEG